MPGNQLPSAVIFPPQSVGSPRFFGRIADFYNPPKESGYMQKQTLTKEQAMQKLRHFCAYQERCHSEVREKLFSLGVWMRDHDEIIAGLIEDNYLNEERFAIQYAGGHYRMKQWGRVKIKYALKQKGVSEYCIRKAMKQIEDEEYERILEQLARKKYESLKGTQWIIRRKRTADYLVQKGYEPDLVRQALDRISSP